MYRAKGQRRQGRGQAKQARPQAANQSPSARPQAHESLGGRTGSRDVPGSVPPVAAGASDAWGANSNAATPDAAAAVAGSQPRQPSTQGTSAQRWRTESDGAVVATGASGVPIASPNVARPDVAAALGKRQPYPTNKQGAKAQRWGSRFILVGTEADCAGVATGGMQMCVPLNQTPPPAIEAEASGVRAASGSAPVATRVSGATVASSSAAASDAAAADGGSQPHQSNSQDASAQADDVRLRTWVRFWAGCSGDTECSQGFIWHCVLVTASSMGVAFHALWVLRNYDSTADKLWLYLALLALAAKISLTIAFFYVRRMPQLVSEGRAVKWHFMTRHRRTRAPYVLAFVASSLVLLLFQMVRDAPCLVFNENCGDFTLYHGRWYVMAWLLFGADLAEAFRVFPFLLVFDVGNAVNAHVKDWCNDLNDEDLPLSERHDVKSFEELRFFLKRNCENCRNVANAILASLVFSAISQGVELWLRKYELKIGLLAALLMFKTICLLTLVKVFSRVYERVAKTCEELSEVERCLHNVEDRDRLSLLRNRMRLDPVGWFVSDKVFVSRKAWLATLAASCLNYAANFVKQKFLAGG